MANSAYIGLQQIVNRGKKAIVSFSEKNILDQLPYALPSSLTIIQIDEEIFQRAGIPERLRQLKADGYQIAVTGFSHNECCMPLYTIADIISYDAGQVPPDEERELLSRARTFSSILMALQVNNRERYNQYLNLGFELFLGAFFKTPDAITVHQFTSNEVARFSLLHAIEQENTDIAALAETIQSDVSISFRLLAYLNSAAFGLRQKVTSIQHAVSLLGWHKIKNWLRVVLITDVNQHPEAAELTTLAAQRGKFLELIARSNDYWGFDPESLHMLGIFSLLDAMLDTPMSEVVGYLPLNDKLKAALCREPNNEYQPLLQLAQFYEEARWREAEEMVHKLNLNKDKVAEAFKQAVDWATELTTLQTLANEQ